MDNLPACLLFLHRSVEISIGEATREDKFQRAMAAVSAWGKPGAWALDSEAHESDQRDKGYDSSDSAAATAPPPAPSADFPSLSAAVTTKPARKKKPQTLTLAEFATGHSVSHGAAAKQSLIAPSYKGLTPDELATLPTGPRERSADELERSSRGFGYSSYGQGRGGPRDGPRGGGATSDEPRRTREPNRDLGPSRADEIDDWGAAKKSAPSPLPERRGRSSGFFDNNPLRADESDSWVSRKSGPPPPAEGRRSNGFDRERNREGIDSETWGRKNNNEINTNGRSNYRDGIDAESWGKKKEDANNTSGGRPRLVLQPRRLAVDNNGNAEQKDQQTPQPRKLPLASGDGNIEQKEEHQQPPKKTSNPFGAARPREQVLAEKGQDWKKMDEKLETMKIREVAPDSGRKGFGVGSAKVDDRTARTWRKPVDAVSASPSPSPRAEKVEDKSADN